MIHYRAAWVVPIAEPPVRESWITVDRSRIVAVSKRVPGDGAPQIDLGDAAVLPGLVNAHTHLELSYLRDQVPPASQFVTWVRDLIAARRRQPDPWSSEIRDAVERAIGEALACGTAIVGDISNTLVTYEALARSPLAAVVFYELIRFGAADPQGFVDDAVRALEALPPAQRVKACLAAHAPYSVAPLVFRAIRQAIDRKPFSSCSVHLSESLEEVEFIRTGSGPWRALLEELGSWDPQWLPPGGTPVQFLDDSGFLDGRVLAVHGVQMDAADLTRLAARGTTLVTCPRSNGYTGAGAPDLNVFAELATMRALAPSVPARTLLDSATRQGSRALGFDADFGTIEAGKLARLIAVSVPSATDDVEEYLVNGVSREQIQWLT